MNAALSSLWDRGFVADRPMVCGHQGHSIDGLSNSVRSVAQAADFGADMVEVDVRRCADGFVVFHDAVLDLRAAGTGLVRNHTIAELSAISHRSLIDGEALDDTIDSLAVILDHAAALELDLMLEIKDGDADEPYFASLLTEIELLGHSDRILISSFNHHQLLAAKRVSASVRTAAIVHERLLNPVEAASQIECDLMALEHWFLHPDDADDLHAAGISVACFIQPPWWFEAGSLMAPGLPVDLAELLDRGSIDVLTADDVGWAVSYLDHHCQSELPAPSGVRGSM